MGHQLKVWLLGEFKVEFDNLHIQSLDMPRLQSLLAYLILHREKLISKNQLASLLWPDVNETQARTNLRRLVFRLRQSWNGFNDYVISTDQTFRWNMDLPFWCDALELLQLVEKGQQTLSAEDRSQLFESAILVRLMPHGRRTIGQPQIFCILGGRFSGLRDWSTAASQAERRAAHSTPLHPECPNFPGWWREFVGQGMLAAGSQPAGRKQLRDVHSCQARVKYFGAEGNRKALH